MANKKGQKPKRWTAEEDKKLLTQVRVFPQNLKKCFMIVSEETGRTVGAVSNHWYTKLSKDPDNLVFFTASAKHVSRNRKNGMGEESNMSVWKKLCNAIKSIFKDK